MHVEGKYLSSMGVCYEILARTLGGSENLKKTWRGLKIFQLNDAASFPSTNLGTT